jgi:hypothetical protein
LPGVCQKPGTFFAGKAQFKKARSKKAPSPKSSIFQKAQFPQKTQIKNSE